MCLLFCRTFTMDDDPDDDELASKYFPDYPGVDHSFRSDSPTGSDNVIFRSSSFTPGSLERYNWNSFDSFSAHNHLGYNGRNDSNSDTEMDRFSDDFALTSHLYDDVFVDELESDMNIEMDVFDDHFVDNLYQYRSHDIVTDLDNDSFEEITDSGDAILNVILRLRSNEGRFGFSVIGGSDEIMSPLVDDIATGK